jgi:hypothetical protein
MGPKENPRNRPNCTWEVIIGGRQLHRSVWRNDLFKISGIEIFG